jgi:hypothetical protein
MNAYAWQPQPSTSAYKRCEERRAASLRGWFTRLYDQSIWDFLIINLSYGGCQLRTGAQLQVGEKLSLYVMRRGVIEATVKWRGGDSVGLEFHVERPSKAHWPRKAPRHKAAIGVLVRRQGRKSQQIDATDVSRLGCCLDFVDAPREGDRLWVQLPCLEPIETTVRWVENYKAGVAFEKPIHSAVFDLLLEMWQGSAPPR